jgi:hypothetical protein
MRLHHRRSTRAATLTAALLVAGAATVLPATAASAADGTGWSGSWRYSAANSIEITADLPGVHLAAAGTDINGIRNLGVQVKDTAADGRCARVFLSASDRGTVADRIVCDGQPIGSVATGNFSGDLTVLLIRGGANGSVEKFINMFVPTSANDAGLRVRGTGLTWSYYTAESFQFNLHRTGATVVGFGRDQSNGTRLTGATVTSESGAQCASGALGDGTGGSSAAACNGQSATFSRANLSGTMPLQACAINPTACVRTQIPAAF